MDEVKGIYESPAQLGAGDLCAMDGCKSGSRGGYMSERFQVGWITLTNAAGVLSAAQGIGPTLFQYGVGGDASGAGFPSGALFRDSETNVSNDNGLHEVVIYAAGVELGAPSYITGSGDTVTLQGSDEIDQYREDILRLLGQNLAVLAIHCPDETAITHSLGNPLRNPSMRGWHDQLFPNAGGLMGMPNLLAREIEVPKASGNKRPFSVTVKTARPLSWDARSTVVTENVIVPVTVTFEVRPLL